MVEVAIGITIIAAFIVGYGIRAIQHPAPKRDKRGRFTKED